MASGRGENREVMTFQLTVYSEDDERLWWCVACSEDERVGTVKKRLISGCGRYISRLFYMGNVLDDKRTLRQCGVNERSILSTGRSASILRGKAGSRGTPDWSPNQSQSHEGPDAQRKPSPSRKTSDVVRHSPKRDAVKSPRREPSAHAHAKEHQRTAPPSSSITSSTRPLHASLGSKEKDPQALHYTLSREEEKLVLEHKIKMLESQLASSKKEGTVAAAGGPESQIAAASSGDTSGVKRWPFRPFRAGLRTPALPLDVSMFAKDDVTSRIAAAALPPPAAPLQQQQNSYQQPPPVSFITSASPPAVQSSFPPLPPAAPHSLLYVPQPPSMPATIYPDQGSLIAKPGFLACPVPLFNTNTSSAPSMTSV